MSVCTGWLISSDTSFIMYKMIYSQTILAIMVFRDSKSNILDDLEDFSGLRPGTVFCMASFMGGKCVLARSENRESRSLLL